MFNQLFAVIAPILICAGLGYAWARHGVQYPVEFVTRLVMNIGAPCLILAAFSKADIEIGYKESKKMYSEEEVIKILYQFHYDLVNSNFDTKEESIFSVILFISV